MHLKPLFLFVLLLFLLVTMPTSKRDEIRRRRQKQKRKREKELAAFKEQAEKAKKAKLLRDAREASLRRDYKLEQRRKYCVWNQCNIKDFHEYEPYRSLYCNQNYHQLFFSP